MNKKIWIICACIFVFITVFVISTDTSSSVRQVRVTNKNLEISSNSANIENSDINVSQNSSQVSHEDVRVANSETQVQKKEFTFNENSIFRNSDVKVENEDSSVSPVNSKVLNKKAEFDNFKNSIDKSINSTSSNNKFKQQDKYAYRYIDWRTWKSEFVNKILDDSAAIKSLDDYASGNFIQYSFLVHKDGTITNINLISPFVTKSDRDKLAVLIKSYEHQPITVFPAGSNKKSAWVNAVMILSNVQTYSTPGDFDFDNERVKTKL
jgi:hypothetical protein